MNGTVCRLLFPVPTLVWPASEALPPHRESNDIRHTALCISPLTSPISSPSHSLLPSLHPCHLFNSRFLFLSDSVPPVSLSPSLSLCLCHMHTHTAPSDSYCPWQPSSLSPISAPIPCNNFPSLLCHILPLVSGSPFSLSLLSFRGLFLQLCLCFSLLFFSIALISLLHLPDAPQVPSMPDPCRIPSSLLLPPPCPLLCSQRGRGSWLERTLYHLCCKRQC